MLRKWILILGLLLTLGLAWGDYYTGFEDATKTAYASGTVTLSDLDWNMTNALIGSDTSDFFNGTKSARLNGKIGSSITMLQDKANGLGEISFLYRRYGTDGQVAWKVEYSSNQGSTWTQIGSPFTAPATSDVQTFSETVNVEGPVRIRVILVNDTGSANRRLNIDDVTITDFTAGGNLLPSITNIIQTPSTDITSSTSVSVSANVTDADGTIASVQLKWGTVTGLYPNAINMSGVGSTYTTVSNIPPQANGSTVYYVVQATDNDAGSTTSSEHAYIVFDPASTTLPFTHDFADGWGDIYTYSVEGVKEWYLYASSASINGYGSVEEEDWMILPAINFNNYSNETMNFNTLGTFGAVDASNYLKLMWSSNYAGIGDPTAASWTEIPFTLANIGAGWAPSGDMDLSGISGTNVHLAFKYHSMLTPTRWEVSDINIFTAGTPIISTLPQFLSGLDYVFGEGPSAIQTFTISGANLSADVILTPETNFQISIMDGASFIPLNPITLSPVGGTLPQTTIYVRLKAGLPIATYSEQITITSTGVDNSTVALSGAVTGPQPTVTILQRPAQIDIGNAEFQSAVMVKLENYPTDDVRYRLYSGTTQYNPWDAATDAWVSTFSYGDGPAVPGTATTSTSWWIPFQIGSNLTTVASYRDRLGPAYSTNHQTQALPAATAITTPAVILDSQVNFTTWNDYTQKYIVLAYNAVTAGDLIAASSTDLATGAFVVRVEAGTSIRRIEIRDVLNNLIESVTGTWPIALNSEIIVTGDVDPLYNIVGMPSEEIGVYHLSGLDLYANIEVVAPTHFEIATSAAGPWSSSLSLDASFDANVYVRINSAVAGEHVGDITHNSAGATQVTMRVEGETFPTTGEIIVNQSLVPFSQELGTPSAAQSYSLQGSGLSGLIIVTAQTPFELSANGTTGWAASLNFAENYNGLVYVRMNADLAGPYAGSIQHSNANSAAVNFMVSGTATPPGELPLLSYWNFNADVPASGVNWAQPIAATQGSGQLTYSFANAVSFGGTTYNGIDGEVAGGSFVPQGGEENVNNGGHFELIAPTTGYEGISLSYASRRTTTGFSTHEILYSTNGTDFISKEIVDISAYTNNWVAGQIVTIDFSGIPAANDNPNFKIKVVLNGASTATGNNRFDNILIDGTAATGGTLDSPVVSIVHSGNNVNLSWNAIPGATQYRVYSDDDPYGDFGFMEVVTPNITVTLPSSGKKFYRVIATDNPPPAK